MIVRHFNIETSATQPPDNKMWEKNWDGFHGYYAMKKCFSQEKWAEMKDQKRLLHEKGEMTLGEFQQDCFLSILADIKTDYVNMFELGAGWGRICLALAGAIDYKAIPLHPQSYQCLAVEGEPTHYQWAKEHFGIHNINGIVVHGAVSHKNGTCWINAHPSPDSCYGQSIHGFIGSRKLPSIKGLYNIITKRSTKIPMYTVDYLIKHKRFDHVHIIQMDVQGAEYDTMLGAAGSINDNLIDYLLIGTHHKELNDKLRQLLSPKFDLFVDLYPRSVGKIDGFAPIHCHDGVQLYKRKGI